MTSAEIFPFLFLSVDHPGPNGTVFIPKLPKDGLLTDCFPPPGAAFAREPNICLARR